MTDDVINTNIIELYNNGMLKLHRLEEAMNLKLQHLTCYWLVHSYTMLENVIVYGFKFVENAHCFLVLAIPTLGVS